MKRRWLLPASLGALGIAYGLASWRLSPDERTLSTAPPATVDRAREATESLRAARPTVPVGALPERPGRTMGGGFTPTVPPNIEPLETDAPSPTTPEPVDFGPLLDADDPLVFAIDPASPPVHIGEPLDADEAAAPPLGLEDPFHVGPDLDADAPSGWELDETPRQPAAIGRVYDAGTPGDL